MINFLSPLYNYISSIASIIHNFSLYFIFLNRVFAHLLRAVENNLFWKIEARIIVLLLIIDISSFHCSWVNSSPRLFWEGRFKHNLRVSGKKCLVGEDSEKTISLGTIRKKWTTKYLFSTITTSLSHLCLAHLCPLALEWLGTQFILGYRKL